MTVLRYKKFHNFITVHCVALSREKNDNTSSSLESYSTLHRGGIFMVLKAEIN